jgi:DNA-directed RNA polymerase beta subunit
MEKEQDTRSNKSEVDSDNGNNDNTFMEDSTNNSSSNLDEESTNNSDNSRSNNSRSNNSFSEDFYKPTKQQISEINEQNEISWKIIDKYFVDNPNNLVAHHLDSYNYFFEYGLQKIFNENNPIRFTEQPLDSSNKNTKKCFLYLGGKDGSKIYIGKPIIYDENHGNEQFYS